MARWWRVGVCLAGGLILLAVGVWGALTHLDAADKVASVVGGVGAVFGLALSVYGVALARRSPASGGQSVTGSTVGGGLVQARGVRGNLRIGPAGAPPPGPEEAPPRAQPASTAPRAGGQSVAGSQVAGSVQQVQDVGGDADLDR
ncbi:hypothetical protein ABZU25_15340 [Micromonospora sp. NPDC005215]|uniref:hypothetical protein n=1 Tax=Micromonospora sp. NPDC005215 TaxID=3157024 RepID=UPI0033A26569